MALFNSTEISMLKMAYLMLLYTTLTNVSPEEEKILPVVLRLVLQGAKVDVVVA